MIFWFLFVYALSVDIVDCNLKYQYDNYLIASAVDPDQTKSMVITKNGSIFSIEKLGLSFVVTEVVNNLTVDHPSFMCYEKNIFVCDSRNGNCYLIMTGSSDKLLTTETNITGLGESVIISGDYGIIGSIYEYYKGYSCGCVKVYGLNGVYVQTLWPLKPHDDMKFGQRLASNANFLAVGNGENTVDLFIYRNNKFEYHSTLTSPLTGIHDNFGSSISIFGYWIAVSSSLGNEFNGIVFLFKYNETIDTFEFYQQLTTPYDDVDWFASKFGESVQFFGTRLIISAPNLSFYGMDSVGSVIFFILDNNKFVPEKWVIPSLRKNSMQFGSIIQKQINTVFIFTNELKPKMCQFKNSLSETHEIIFKLSLNISESDNITSLFSQITFNVANSLSINKNKIFCGVSQTIITDTFEIKKVYIKIEGENVSKLSSVTDYLGVLVDDLFSPTSHDFVISDRQKLHLNIISPISIEYN
ncbi:hypothetical protein KM1_080590 [Entamoeba histolytica HM-3:IMSS]|uniref:Uncharacterized protein n=2 Tax=Entamoeba histolytica TaxID=5759 RepID=A0A175JPA1_ENTHI|nr:hypothetical protein KM1_080590 [Entamoeba histolytica HM-3:IMSS]GAT95276.1 hypothetical protein CL6EHI_165210 [Entamoeba histolytica]